MGVEYISQEEYANRFRNFGMDLLELVEHF